MKKCNKTLSGKHIWANATIQNQDVENKEYWIMKVKQCHACKIIDDRGVEKVNSKAEWGGDK